MWVGVAEEVGIKLISARLELACWGLSLAIIAYEQLIIQISQNGRQPQFFQMEDDLNFFLGNLGS